MSKILLVDDDEFQRDLMRHRLANKCALCVVDTIADAERTLKDQEFDAILLDVGLPDTPSDFETIARIKSARHNAAVVILSGNDDPNFIRDAIRMSANGYIVKGRGDRTYASISTEVDKAIENKRQLDAENHNHP